MAEQKRNDSYAALFFVGISKDMRVEIKNGLALNDSLFDFVKKTLLDFFREKLTDEEKRKLLEVLWTENKDVMEPPPRKRAPRKEAAKSKIILKKSKPDPFKGGYRSPYLPPKKK